MFISYSSQLNCKLKYVVLILVVYECILISHCNFYSLRTNWTCRQPRQGNLLRGRDLRRRVTGQVDPSLSGCGGAHRRLDGGDSSVWRRWRGQWRWSCWRRWRRRGMVRRRMFWKFLLSLGIIYHISIILYIKSYFPQNKESYLVSAFFCSRLRWNVFIRP